MRLLLILFILFFHNPLLQAKSIAITFDDAPRAGNGYFDAAMRAENLINALSDSGVTEATFFVNSSRINKEGKRRLLKYANNGHWIANHSDRHFDFNTTTLEDYENDFLAAHKILESYPNFRKWFRFPYLREGNTAKKRNEFRDTLKSKNYKNAYITVNNYDWYMELIFQKALTEGQKIDFSALKNVYVDVLVDSVLYYDSMALDVLGRSPKHILLLHENDLAAMFIDDLILALRAKGWQIISLEDALTDEISSYSTKRVLKFNPGRIGEIAKDKDWSGRLWHKACNEEYLEKLFADAGVYR